MTGSGSAGRRLLLSAALMLGSTLFGVLPQEGAAQQSEVAAPAGPAGLLRTQVFKKPVETAAIAVAPYDDSDLNLKLKSDFEAKLAESGRGRVAKEAEADYLLLFESEVVPADAVPRGPSLGSANVTEGSAEVNVNVWSSSKDSVLGGRQQAADVGSNVFHINAVLRERRSGEVAWQGDAYHRLAGPETEHVARAMVAPLVQKIGQSVAREPFEIR